MNPERHFVRVVATNRPKTDDVELACGHVKKVPRWLSSVAAQLRWTCADCARRGGGR